MKNKSKKKNEIIMVFLLSILAIGCKNKSVIYFYSLDKSQCITVISEYDQRYIIDGKHDILPDTNYVKLHVKDRNSATDDFHICWNNEIFEWDAVVRNTEILKSKLDTTKFNFNNKLPKDERGTPTEIKFREGKCAVYSFYSGELSPERGAIVEYK